MDEETRALRDTCTTFLVGDGPVSPADLLAAIPRDTQADVYGDGGVVADLEAYVADLLGAPAALFLPSGTMAQAATLRVHCSSRRGPVLWHQTAHLENHEGDSYARVHGLTRRVVGSPERWITAADLPAEEFSALVLELPMRELGGVLPTWEALVELVSAARARGAAVHLDGARLWEASAGFERSPAEIATLFDTTYVSFYKGVGALPGCCVTGPSEVVAQVREWRRRLGGTLFGMWPNAASALAQLPGRLAEMPARLDHARAISLALQAVPGVAVVPDPPQVPMMHLLLTVDPEAYAANQRRLAVEAETWAWPTPISTTDPRVLRVELGVGRATLQLAPQAVAAAVASLIG